MKPFEITINMDGGVCSACRKKKSELWGKRRVCLSCLRTITSKKITDKLQKDKTK